MSNQTNIHLEGNEMTVAQIAIAYPGAVAIFNKYNIDYCCGGHRSLDDACQRVGIDPGQVRAELSESSVADPSYALRPETWSSTFLVDFIIQNHHSFVRKADLELQPLLDKVCERHGDEHNELLQIRDRFLELSQELSTHMNREEAVLFPAITRLDSQHSFNHPIERIIQAPIMAMEDEHVAAGDLVKEIRMLSNNYTPPDYACPTFQVTFRKLKEFDEDLMRHIHLENNILFKRFKKPASCSL